MWTNSFASERPQKYKPMKLSQLPKPQKFKPSKLTPYGNELDI